MKTSRPIPQSCLRPVFAYGPGLLNLLSATLLLLLLAGTASAADKTKDAASAKAKKTRSAPATTVEVTGSHIKHRVDADGRVTSTSYPLSVIDQKAIASFGATSIRQVLCRQGFSR